MNSEKIIMELSRISTPTGITCCGDITLDDSTCDEIIEYIIDLEKSLEKIKRYCESNIGTYKSLSEDEYSEDCCVDGFHILKIINEGMEKNNEDK